MMPNKKLSHPEHDRDKITADSQAHPSSIGTHYRITIQGHLEEHWAAWFDDLHITQDGHGNTMLSGVFLDQASLHGTLAKIRDLGLPLISLSPFNLES